MPKISVITPCYNAEKYIAATVASLHAQTVSDWEHIVVDDGSNDSSSAIVAQLAEKDTRIKLVQQPNGGVSKARNTGFRAASADSEYLLFLDADDCLEPTMLEVLARYLDEHPQVGLAYCSYIFIDENDREIPTKYFERFAPTRWGVRVLPDSHPRTPFVSIFCWAPVMESLSLLRRSIYEQTPGWDETLGHIGEGVDLFSQFALLSEVHYVPQKLYRYRQHTSQATATADRVHQQERKVLEKWRNLAHLTPRQRAAVTEALWFREKRLMPYIGLRDGVLHLRQGHIALALRFFVGALRRYLTSLWPRRSQNQSLSR